MPFERGRPGDELEAKSVADHRKTSGSERKTLAIGAGDIAAPGDMVEAPSGVGRELGAGHLQLATAQRIKQAACEDDPATPPFR